MRIISAAFFSLLAVAPVLALDPHTPLARYSQQTWGIESGLPQNTVHSIVQTRDGYLWLGTEGGLVRFDGLGFVVFDTQNTPSLKSNTILSLFEDRIGALWIGTADGLVRWQDGKFSTFTTNDGLPGDSIWSFVELRSGALLALTSGGLARYTGKRFESYPATGAANAGISAIAEDSDGALWIATPDRIRISANRGTASGETPPLLPEGNIQALLVDRAGRVWIGTADGLTEYQGGKSKTYRTGDGLPGNRITAIYQDREGTVWVSTDRGVARITNKGIERFASNDFLSGNLILSFYEDREGDLWMGTESGGLAVLRDPKFFTYAKREGLSDDFARCVFQDGKGVIWVGTNAGLDRFDGHGFSTLTTADGLSSNVIFSLDEDSHGGLLVGTPDGLNVLQNGHITVFTNADGLADNFVRSIYRDSDGSIWIGTRAGLSHRIGNKFETYTQADGLGGDLVGALLRDRNKNLWIGTQRGLTGLRAGHFTTYTTKNGLSSNIVTALYEDPEGTLWIGTQQGGLNSFHKGQIVSYPTKFGLPNVIYGILEDNAHDLWIASQNGIFRVSKAALTSFAEGRSGGSTAVQYGTADGLRVDECSGGAHPAAWKSRDGSLWFATLKGVAVLPANRMAVNSLPPPVSLESVTIDDRVFRPDSIGEIPAGRSRFSFEYAGLSFVSPHKVRFKYKLDGFDRDWIDAGSRRVAYYTNLAPGKYRFRVIACNNDGVWNTSGAGFSFRLDPRFYQTRWFDLLVVIAFGLLCYAAYSWRVRQVKSRFDAVLAERSRIAREIHDTLAQGFIGVSVHLEVAESMLPASAEQSREQLETARTLVRNSLSEARRSIWQLRSPDAPDGNLASRLSGFVQQAAGKSSAKLEFRVSGTHRPLPHKIENEFLKIGQEAVMNALRHADAKIVKVDLLFEPRRLRMLIADDGRGFIQENGSSGPNGHFGLQGMRERAEQMDAELIVTSAPGEGTSVSVEAVIH